LDFIAIGIETANQWRDSVCSIELVKVVQNEIVDSLFSYINPKQTFDEYHISQHGITEDLVQHSPTFHTFYPILDEWLTNQFVIGYYHDYDQSVIEEACATIDKLSPYCRFGSILPFVKNKWQHQQNFSLQTLASQFGISLEKERAEIIAELVLTFPKKFDNFSINELTHQVVFPTAHQSSFCSPIDFQDKTVVFTGKLEGLSRSMAAKKIRAIGGIFSNTVTKQTDILIVSDSSWQKAQLGQKSTKLLKAEHLQTLGFTIDIIPEKNLKKI